MQIMHDPHGTGATSGSRRRDAPAGFRRIGLAALAATLVLGAGPAGVQAAKPRPKPPAVSGSFDDNFEFYDSARWSKADGWKNGSPFDNAWLADHVTVAGGLLDLRLDDVAMLGEPYSSGELRTNGYYGYGCYEASFKPIMVPGVVTALFTFAGPYDNGGNGKHNEIDIEFLGNRPGYVQLNFWTNDDAYASSNEKLIFLGSYDFTDSYHRYGFRWTSTGIDWFVDGNLLYSVTDSRSNPTPKAAESLQKIMVNAWPVDETAELWAGKFEYPGTPLHATYEWVRHIAGEDCDLTQPPATTPPPSGDPGTMLVADIALALNSQATQVIARVSVVDGLGQPVQGATVTGRWSGVITTGDTSRTTDAAGIATFYSSRSRTPGEVRFCVAGISHGSRVHDPDADRERCDVITK
jgi:endo-1,3-1,4-beta-glycanase ExoK